MSSESSSSSSSNTSNSKNTSSNSSSSSSSSSGSGSGSSSGSNEEANFDCNICLFTCTEPVISQCGHLFCWACLYRWLQTSPQPDCPVCKSANVSASTVIPLYGRGKSRNPNDPAFAGIPPPPQGQRTPPTQQQQHRGGGTRGLGGGPAFGFGGPGMDSNLRYHNPFHFMPGIQIGGTNVSFSAGFAFLPALLGLTLANINWGNMWQQLGIGGNANANANANANGNVNGGSATAATSGGAGAGVGGSAFGSGFGGAEEEEDDRFSKALLYLGISAVVSLLFY